MKKTFYAFALYIICVSSVASQQRGSIVSYQYKDFKEVGQLTSSIRSTIQAQFGNIPGALFYWWATSFYLNPRYDINMYKVTYNTLNQKNQPVVATGLVVVPKTHGTKAPITTYCHGTVFKKETVPSNLCGAGDCFEINIPYLMAADGHIIVAPDYVGMGDSNQTHPYVESISESNATIDLMRAARTLTNSLPWEYAKADGTNYLSGYSQGGHAGLATLQAMHAQNLWNEFNVRFVGVGGSPADLSNTQFDFILNNPNYPTREYILYCIATAKLVDDTIFTSIDTILKPQYVALYNQHILGQTGDVSWVPLQWNDLFLPGVVDQFKKPNSKLRQVLGRSNVYDYWNNVATRLYAVSQDEQVSVDNSWLTEWKMKEKLPWWQKGLIKADIFSTIAGNDHATGGLFSFIYWTNRMAGYRSWWGGNNWKTTDDRRDNASAYLDIKGKKLSMKTISESFIELKGTEKIISAQIFDSNNQLVASPEIQDLKQTKNISTHNLETGFYKLVLGFEDKSSTEVPIMLEKPTYEEAQGLVENEESVIFPSTEIKMEGNIRVSVFDEKGKVLQVIESINKKENLVISKTLLHKVGNYFVEFDNLASKFLYTFRVNPNTGSFAVSGLKISLDSQDNSFVLNRKKGEFLSMEIYNLDGKLIKTTQENRFYLDAPKSVYLVKIHRLDGSFDVQKIKN